MNSLLMHARLLLWLAVPLAALTGRPAIGYAQDPSVYVVPDAVSASTVTDRALCTQAESNATVYFALYAGNGGQAAERWCAALLALNDSVVPIDPGHDLPHAGPEAVVSECALFMPDPSRPDLYSWGAVWSTLQGLDDAVDQCSLFGSSLMVTWRVGLKPAAGEVVPVQCSDGWASARGAQLDACARHGGVEAD